MTKREFDLTTSILEKKLARAIAETDAELVPVYVIRERVE